MAGIIKIFHHGHCSSFLHGFPQGGTPTKEHFNRNASAHREFRHAYIVEDFVKIRTLRLRHSLQGVLAGTATAGNEQVEGEKARPCYMLQLLKFPQQPFLIAKCAVYHDQMHRSQPFEITNSVGSGCTTLRTFSMKRGTITTTSTNAMTARRTYALQLFATSSAPPFCTNGRKSEQG